MSDNPERVVIGIDLGTTRCCICHVDRAGRPQIIPNDLGRNTTPSWVLYDSADILVGDAAINAKNTGKNLINDSKRLIGRQFNDEDVTKDRKHLSFEVVRKHGEPHDGKVMIKLGDRTVSPEEVSSELLKKMKEYAETYFEGREITDAVITVPAYFDVRQKDATERAAKMANLNVLKLLTEPTAAAIAYAVRNRNQLRTVLIYDLGGGTFDVTIGRFENGDVEVVAISGHRHLGGEDFDNKIVDDFIKDFQNKQPINFPNDKNTIRRLRNLCREAKENMAGMEAPQLVELSVRVNETDYLHQYSIGRKRFYELCDPLFKGTMDVVDDALNIGNKHMEDRNMGNLTADSIDEILIVGGSTRIPRIKELIREKFPRASILQCINPDEAVATGAALYGADLARDGQNPPRPTQLNSNSSADDSIAEIPAAAFVTLQIREVVPLSLGMEMRGGIIEHAISRGTAYSCRSVISSSTVVDNQGYFEAKIYEGERARATDNTEIGIISMNLTPGPRGSPHKTIFEVNNIGILNVIHVEESTGRQANFQFTFNGPIRESKDIAYFHAEAVRNENEDKKFREMCKKRRLFENYLHHEKDRIQRMPASQNRDTCLESISRYIAWLDGFPEDEVEIESNHEKFKKEVTRLGF